MFIFNWILKAVADFFNSLLDLTYKNTETVVNEKARTDAHAAVLARARLRRNRRVLNILYHLFVVLFTGVPAVWILFVDDYCWVSRIAICFALGSVALVSFFSLFVDDMGNISDLEVSDVMAYGSPYALYLRAFESDYRQRVFREEDLTRVLEGRNIVIFTIGSPEEIDACLGAIRVYVNNDTWQEEVLAMMERASCVFLRVCNTEACLWEIAQSLSLDKELYIIIDSLEDYNAVCDQCAGLPKDIIVKQGEYSIYKRLPDGSWEKLSLDEPECDADCDNSYKENYVAALLEQYPMITDESVQSNEGINKEDYVYDVDRSIRGLCDNIVVGWETQYTDPVAERIIDLLDVYYSNYGEEEEVLTNIYEYMNKLRIIHPLSSRVLRKREQLFDKIGLF